MFPAQSIYDSRDSAFERIGKFREEYNSKASLLSDANEAKTRLLLIDNVLNVLGWSRNEFNPEEVAGAAGYTDYLLSIDNIPRLIVEAKRLSSTFGVPFRKSRRIHYTLKYFRSAYGQALSEVLSQAERYCIERKIPYAVITNGAEWFLIRLLPSPGYSSIEDLKGVYFGNLFSNSFNFELFWELLSKESVNEGSLDKHFSRLNVKEAEYSSTPNTRFGELEWRNVTDSEDIRDFYRLFFDEIIDPSRRKMLELCFVTNARLDQYQGELQRTIKDSTPGYVENAIDLSPEEREQLLQVQSGEVKGRVVLVTGSVGCGKSTLITKVLVEAHQNNDLIPLKVDLIDELGGHTDIITNQLWKYLEREWKKAEPNSYSHESLSKIFRREISHLKKGPYARVFEEDTLEYARQEAALLAQHSSNPETFFTDCWRFYKQRNKGIIVFLDNVDRASETFQKQVYFFAHKLARETGATVIITMREFTFFRGKEAGFLDIRSSDTIFHLQSPNLVQLLSKRIQYIEKFLTEDYRYSSWIKRDDWKSFHDSMLRHASMLKSSFLSSKEGTESLSLLDAISWHDVRYFFEVLRQIHIMLGSNSPSWRIQEIIASLMMPTKIGNISPVISNLFRPPFPTYPCYFLKCRILLMLIYGQQIYQTRRGSSLTSLLTFLAIYGYHESWSRRAIQELVQQRFLECLEAPTAEDYTKTYTLSETHSFRPSPLSIVLLEKIITDPVYLCLIGNNLPFYDPNAIGKYEAALQEIYETLDENQLERDAIGLFSDTTMGQVVSAYLSSVFWDEPFPVNMMNHAPELRATEDKLRQIIERLNKYAKISIRTSPSYEISPQLLLFPEIQQTDVIHLSSMKIPPIPENMMDITIGQSEQAPLIFWALVALRMNGQETSIGVQITDVINEFLVDDHHKKAPNNISRSLRSAFLQSQSWLKTHVISERKKSFSLSDGWEVHWFDVFGSTPPLIDGTVEE